MSMHASSVAPASNRLACFGHYSACRRVDGRTLLIAVLAELVWAHTPEYPDEAPLVRARRCQATSHPTLRTFVSSPYH